MKKTSIVFTAPMAAGALLLTGCAGSTTDGSPGVTGKELTIAVSTPLSGPAAAAGAGNLCGVEAYLNMVNSSGGIGGYTFKVTGEDNKFDPATAATIARNVASDDTVFAVAIAGSGPLDASRPTLEAAQIPTFGVGNGSAYVPPAWAGDYGYLPQYEREASSAAQFISASLKLKTASMVYVDTATGQPASKSFPPAYEAAGGTVALNEPIPPATTDFSAAAQKLKDAGAPVVYAAILDTQFAGLQKAAHAIGYDPKWVTWATAYGPTYLKLAGDLAKGVYTSQWAWPANQTSEPGVKEFVAAVNAKCPDSLGDGGVANGYGMASMIAHGVKQLNDAGKDVTRANFVANFAINGETVANTPNMTISSDDHSAVESNSYWQASSAQGDLVLVTPFATLPTVTR
jgi:branched-chain amino acid transport system substrate-binding protein